MAEEDFDDIVGDLVSQLKCTTALSRREPEETLEKEQLEAFIIKNSGKLITKTLGVIDSVQDYIQGSPDAKDVAAFAELLKAASSSIEALNKVYISVEKNKNTKELKQMDIDSREKINTQDSAVFLMSRKEMMQALIERSESLDTKNVVDV